MGGIESILKSSILTWQKLIDAISKIEPVTGDKLNQYFGNNINTCTCIIAYKIEPTYMYFDHHAFKINIIPAVLV